MELPGINDRRLEDLTDVAEISANISGLLETDLLAGLDTKTKNMVQLVADAGKPVTEETISIIKEWGTPNYMATSDDLTGIVFEPAYVREDASVKACTPEEKSKHIKIKRDHKFDVQEWNTITSYTENEFSHLCSTKENNGELYSDIRKYVEGEHFYKIYVDVDVYDDVPDLKSIRGIYHAQQHKINKDDRSKLTDQDLFIWGIQTVYPKGHPHEGEQLLRFKRTKTRKKVTAGYFKFGLFGYGLYNVFIDPLLRGKGIMSYVMEQVKKMMPREMFYTTTKSPAMEQVFLKSGLVKVGTCTPLYNAGVKSIQTEQTYLWDPALTKLMEDMNKVKANVLSASELGIKSTRESSDTLDGFYTKEQLLRFMITGDTKGKIVLGKDHTNPLSQYQDKPIIKFVNTDMFHGENPDQSSILKLEEYISEFSTFFGKSRYYINAGNANNDRDLVSQGITLLNAYTSDAKRIETDLRAHHQKVLSQADTQKELSKVTFRNLFPQDATVDYIFEIYHNRKVDEAKGMSYTSDAIKPIGMNQAYTKGDTTVEAYPMISYAGETTVPKYNQYKKVTSNINFNPVYFDGQTTLHVPEQIIKVQLPYILEEDQSACKFIKYFAYPKDYSFATNIQNLSDGTELFGSIKPPYGSSKYWGLKPLKVGQAISYDVDNDDNVVKNYGYLHTIETQELEKIDEIGATNPLVHSHRVEETILTGVSVSEQEFKDCSKILSLDLGMDYAGAILTNLIGTYSTNLEDSTSEILIDTISFETNKMWITYSNTKTEIPLKDLFDAMVQIKFGLLTDLFKNSSVESVRDQILDIELKSVPNREMIRFVLTLLAYRTSNECW